MDTPFPSHPKILTAYNKNYCNCCIHASFFWSALPKKVDEGSPDTLPPPQQNSGPFLLPSTTKLFFSMAMSSHQLKSVHKLLDSLNTTVTSTPIQFDFASLAFGGFINSNNTTTTIILFIIVTPILFFSGNSASGLNCQEPYNGGLPGLWPSKLSLAPVGYP